MSNRELARHAINEYRHTKEWTLDVPQGNARSVNQTTRTATRDVGLPPMPSAQIGFRGALFAFIVIIICVWGLMKLFLQLFG